MVLRIRATALLLVVLMVIVILDVVVCVIFEVAVVAVVMVAGPAAEDRRIQMVVGNSDSAVSVAMMMRIAALQVKLRDVIFRGTSHHWLSDGGICHWMSSGRHCKLCCSIAAVVDLWQLAAAAIGPTVDCS